MPATEKRIAELILRRLLRELAPEEGRELREEYLDKSDKNQQKLTELTHLGKLRDKLRKYYDSQPDAGPVSYPLFGHALFLPVIQS